MMNNIEKKNPFRVPENYFSNFNHEIMNKLPEKEVQKKIVPLWKSISKWTAAAAVVTGVAILGVNYMENHTPNINGLSSEQLLGSGDSTSSLQDDYYQFIEEDATQVAYRDEFFNEQ